MAAPGHRLAGRTRRNGKAAQASLWRRHTLRPLTIDLLTFAARSKAPGSRFHRIEHLVRSFVWAPPAPPSFSTALQGMGPPILDTRVTRQICPWIGPQGTRGADDGRTRRSSRERAKRSASDAALASAPSSLRVAP